MPLPHQGASIKILVNHIKKTLQYIISLILMALFLYWAFEGINLDDLWASLRNISLFWLAALILTTLITLVLRAWRWIVLMRPFASQISLWNATLALAICYAGNIFVPRSGEALRAFSLYWTRGTSLSSVLATVVVERIFDMVWLIIFVGISLLLLRDRLDVINQAFPTVGPQLGMLTLLILLACILALTGLLLISLYRERALKLVDCLLSKISKRLAKALIGTLETFIQGLAALRTPSAYGEILVSSLILNLGYILIVYEAFLAFDIPLGWDAALVIMALSALGMVVPTPSGAGSYHFFFSQGLIVLYATTTDLALACATAVHAIANLTYLALGGPALLLQRKKVPASQGQSLMPD